MVKDIGHACEILTEKTQSEHGVEYVYSGFMLSIIYSMGAGSFWRNHLHIYMSHVCSSAKGFIACITTFDSENKLTVLSIMYLPSEDEHSYTIFLEYFKKHYPNLSSCKNPAVSGDGVNGLAQALAE